LIVLSVTKLAIWTCIL